MLMCSLTDPPPPNPSVVAAFKLRDLVDLNQMSLLSLVTCCFVFSLLMLLSKVIC